MAEAMTRLGTHDPGIRRRCINQARRAEARAQRLTTRYGVPPASARNLQTAIIQGTMQQSSPGSQKGKDGEYQAAVSRMGRATVGAFRTTQLGIVATESTLTPARALLDHRQARYPQRLLRLARPEGGGRRRPSRDGARGEAEGGKEAAGHRDGGRAGMERYANFPGRRICRKEAEALEFAAGRKTETIPPGRTSLELKEEERGQRWPGCRVCMRHTASEARKPRKH